MSSKQELANAEAFVEFANLDGGGVDLFRAKNDDFVPAPWWTYRNGAQWKMSQKFLRDAWDKKFALDMFELLRLLQSFFDPNKLWEAEMGYPKESRREPAFATLIETEGYFLPCQRAVMFLKEENWRVRVCGCGKRYVADHPRRKYCSIACPIWRDEQEKRAHSEHRKKQKRKWWNKRGRKQRKH
jgi:hypothetical protein